MRYFRVVNKRSGPDIVCELCVEDDLDTILGEITDALDQDCERCFRATVM